MSLLSCFTGGVESGEFEQVPTDETAILILSVINGIIRYSEMNPDWEKDLRKAAVNLCRRSLKNGNLKGNL